MVAGGKKLVCENSVTMNTLVKIRAYAAARMLLCLSCGRRKGEMGESEECPAATAVARINLSHAKVARSASNEEIIQRLCWNIFIVVLSWLYIFCSAALV